MGNKRHLERWQFAVLSFKSKFPKKVKEGLEGWGTDKLSVCLHSFFFSLLLTKQTLCIMQ